ncbi:MAG: Peptidase M16 family protein [Parcubacteria group bacterium GW2011_GWF2_40_69]|nr:MAG: Peptidase M16 family protein [Parcubacteria group bacterium GW2011_GWF2_40_69]
MSVYYKNLPWAPCINVYVVFNTGAFIDPIGKEGLSHYLEHMIFNGSKKIKNKKLQKEWSKKYALNSWNAYTNLYQTVFHLRCLPENYKDVLVGMKDMIFNPLLKAKDVEHERKVITQEAWKRFKNQKFLAYTRKYLENLYTGHNFSRVSSALGWPETIAKISHLDIKNYHKEKYVKKNMSIFLAGAIKEKDLKLVDVFVNNIPEGIFSEYEKGLVQKPKNKKSVVNSDDIGDPQEQVEYQRKRHKLYRSSGHSYGIC